MPATLIPTSPNSPMYQDAVSRFWSSWSNPTMTKPTVVNAFYVNHQGHQVWKNYDKYLNEVGNEQYMWHGTTRACTIGDDNSQVTACQLHNCSVCHILRATLDPSKSSKKSMFGIGAYVAPSSSKSYDPKYLKNADPQNSPNLVMLRCAVAVGRTKHAKGPMKGIREPPSGYDSVSGDKNKTLTGRRPGETIKNDETVVFTKSAILPVEVIVLRDSLNTTYVSPYSAFTTRLQNVTDADWNKYPEAIRDTYKGEILWTDGNDSYQFASAQRIRAYKVVRKDRSGNVIAEGSIFLDPFYFKLV
ncbi:hypothetical protein JAAARDRAFT_68789 [Jaapia argillacea MUCL 33604]|uniref:PARP catalytic domain-containing protein n=1 Tax=Jaapia argillacea MUCL 33604 TaxID=933084 RepID=A0A067Q9M8_9AGAM|nr:hypothetical protein JAAARDRAFT_68789 [Jaapia argillacea MUCL 33604]